MGGGSVDTPQEQTLPCKGCFVDFKVFSVPFGPLSYHASHLTQDSKDWFECSGMLYLSMSFI